MPVRYLHISVTSGIRSRRPCALKTQCVRTHAWVWDVGVIYVDVVFAAVMADTRRCSSAVPAPVNRLLDLGLAGRVPSVETLGLDLPSLPGLVGSPGLASNGRTRTWRIGLVNVA